MIKLINTVNLYSGSGSGDVIGFRQGDLDGACGIYSVVTAMVAGGIISREEAKNAWVTTPDGRTRLWHAIAHLPVLAQDGTDCDEQIILIKALDWYVNKHKCNPQKLVGTGIKLFPQVIKSIDNSCPVILAVEWQGGGAHAVVAVGYEAQIDGQPDSLLIVDPGFKINKVQLWNAVLSCNASKRGSKPYHYCR